MIFLKKVYKKIMPHSLFGRSLLIIVMPLLLTMMLATFVFFDRHWSKTTERLINSLAGEVSMVTMQINADNTPESITQISESAFKHFGFTVTYRDKIGTDHLNSSASPFFSITDVLNKALQQQNVSQFYTRSYEKNGRKIINVSVEVDSGLLIFEIPEKRVFSSTTYIFLLAMLGGGFFLMGIAIIFMRNQVRPVRRLAIAAEKLGKGEDVKRFKPEGAREVRKAANAFLVMRERIKRQVRQRTDMLAGVSHDLRTPLTRLKLQLAMLEQNDDVIDMKDDIASMEQMIDGYLAFARGDEDEETVPVNLNELLNACIDDAKRRQQNINFNDKDAEHQLRLRKNAMKRLFDNLISNAGKYADTCWISVKPLPNALEIWIEDNGKGIPKEQIDEVFKPFYRLDESRNMDEAGVGLGLSIARDIAISHGGDIRLEKSTHNGLKAVIRLPL